MKKLVPFGLLVIEVMGLKLTVKAQPPDTLWTRTFGGSSWDRGYSVQQTTDGGYVIAGQTLSFGAGYGDVYLIKTDGQGHQIWQRALGGSQEDWGNSVQQTADGGYIIAGITNSFGAGGSDVYLIKTDASGNQIWQHTFGGSNNEYGSSMRLTADGGCIIAAVTASYGAGYYDVYLIKTDSLGNLTWQRTFGGDDADYGISVQQTSDSGYVIVGATFSYGAGSQDVYLIKTDTQGNLTWQRTFGGSNWDSGNDVQQTSDGGYIVVGETYSYAINGDDIYLIKTDTSGNMVWQRRFGVSGGDDVGLSVQQTSAGDYVIAGYTWGPNDWDVYMIKTDAESNQIWQRTFGGSGADAAYDLQQTSDGNYVIVGETSSYGAGYSDVYLIRTDAGGQALDISLTPVASPIVIPLQGGAFQFNADVTNYGTQTPFTAWARIKYPDGTYTSPTLGPVTLNPPVGQTITRQRTQNVPGSWPSGVYTYLGYANSIYSYPALDSSYFIFTKLTSDDGSPWITEAFCTGEPFPGERSQTASLPSGLDLGVLPNPFNPATALSYELRAVSYVSLRVYDTAGRLVTTLVDGQQGAGEHSITFDGSKLASGIYLVSLTAGGQSQVQKIILLK